MPSFFISAWNVSVVIGVMNVSLKGENHAKTVFSHITYHSCNFSSRLCFEREFSSENS